MSPEGGAPPSERDFAADEILRDGGSVHLRAARPGDDGLIQHHNQLMHVVDIPEHIENRVLHR